MPLTTGKMRPEHENKICKNFKRLKNDMDAKDLTDTFIQEEVFDVRDMERINGYNPNTQDNRNNEFFQLLFQSGPRAYEIFLKALRENGLEFLADMVVNTELTGDNQHTGDELLVFPNLSNQPAQNIYSHQALMYVNPCQTGQFGATQQQMMVPPNLMLQPNISQRMSQLKIVDPVTVKDISGEIYHKDDPAAPGEPGAHGTPASFESKYGILEFTKGGDSAPTTPTTGLPMKDVRDKLNKLIVIDKTDNENVFDWIESNVDVPTTKQAQFVRELMTAVCLSAITKDKKRMEVDRVEITQRNHLLQKYLDHQPESQLQALYALQALITKLEHPAGLLRQMFDILYDEDIISEDAFFQWERSDDEPDGKGVAMKQVVQFFTWLKEAIIDENLHIQDIKKLEFTKGGDSAPTTPTTGLPMKDVRDKLNKLIVVDKTDNKNVFDWIESNVDVPTTKQAQFVRELMTAVCLSAITTKDKTRMEVDRVEITQRNHLLQKYLDHQPESELQALYALQALITKLEHPAGLLRQMFDILYDEDIISENAFYQWERSDDEPDGKSVAMKQVVQFFTWLKEAEEES